MSGLKPPTAQERPLKGSTSELSGRKKVTLAPGHSLMDWIRLGRTQGDLSGITVKRRDLTLADLAQHNRPDDIWMALRGKVYNITPYMNYHPGGVDELMRAAGKDGTELFDDIHNWVNLESMLEKCLVGYLSRETGASAAIALTRTPSVAPPTHDWYQKDRFLVVVVYTKWEKLQREHAIVEISATEVKIQLIIAEFTYFVHFKPCTPVKDAVKVTANSGKCEIWLEKTSDKRWVSLGEPLNSHQDYHRTKSLTPQYRKWTVTSNTPVNHNTVLLRLKAPKGLTMRTPIGYHIHIVTDISGMQIGRSYTIVTPSLTNPSSDEDQEEGRAIHLMVKTYPGGTLSPWVTSAKVGDTMKVSFYDGNFDIQRLNNITHLIMFAAGTGFTTMVRLIAYSLKIPQATFPIKLVFYNKTQADILWRNQLAKLEADQPRFSATHILSAEPQNSGWKGLRGRVCKPHLEQFVPSPSASCRPLLCICGQWAYNDAVENLAKLLNLKEENICIFAQT